MEATADELETTLGNKARLPFKKNKSNQTNKQKKREKFILSQFYRPKV
jgi:hypothetical protein